MKSDESEKAFRAGFNCAQAVLIPFARDRELGEDEGARIASSFGAGMGKMQETCGAVTGAFMALGLRRGFERGDDQEGRARALRLTQDFIAAFKAEFGTLLCKDLLGCDLNTEEGQRVHKESKQREEICAKCVRFAAATVEAMAGGAA
jgi:C_GCAxxG_C_C family probable redox protein